MTEQPTKLYGKCRGVVMIKTSRMPANIKVVSGW